VSEGRRREFAAFGWDFNDVPDPQDPETFLRSKLNWEEREQSPHGELLAWYRELIRIRSERPELCSAEARVVYDEAAGTLEMRRPGLSVCCDFGSNEVEIHFEKHAAAA
jgi:maltooligosyltrehalose trehalohydrolase